MADDKNVADSVRAGGVAAMAAIMDQESDLPDMMDIDPFEGNDIETGDILGDEGASIDKETVQKNVGIKPDDDGVESTGFVSPTLSAVVEESRRVTEYHNRIQEENVKQVANDKRKTDEVATENTEVGKKEQKTKLNQERMILDKKKARLKKIENADGGILDNLAGLSVIGMLSPSLAGILGSAAMARSTIRDTRVKQLKKEIHKEEVEKFQKEEENRKEKLRREGKTEKEIKAIIREENAGIKARKAILAEEGHDDDDINDIIKEEREEGVDFTQFKMPKPAESDLPPMMGGGGLIPIQQPDTDAMVSRGFDIPVTDMSFVGEFIERQDATVARLLSIEEVLKAQLDTEKELLRRQEISADEAIEAQRENARKKDAPLGIPVGSNDERDDESGGFLSNVLSGANPLRAGSVGGLGTAALLKTRQILGAVGSGARSAVRGTVRGVSGAARGAGNVVRSARNGTLGQNAIRGARGIGGRASELVRGVSGAARGALGGSRVLGGLGRAASVGGRLLGPAGIAMAGYDVVNETMNYFSADRKIQQAVDMIRDTFPAPYNGIDQNTLARLATEFTDINGETTAYSVGSMIRAYEERYGDINNGIAMLLSHIESDEFDGFHPPRISTRARRQRIINEKIDEIESRQTRDNMIQSLRTPQPNIEIPDSTSTNFRVTEREDISGNTVAVKDPFDLMGPPELGSITAQYESGGMGVSAISSGRGDPGGVSYGTYQLSSNAGTLNRYLQSQEGRDIAERYGLDRFRPGTEEFNAAYSRAASEIPEEFHQSQHDFIRRTHFEPVLNRAERLGYSVDNPAVQEALWSQSVQHGRSGNFRILERANPSGSVTDQLDSLQQQRSEYVSSLSSLPRSTANNILDRYEREYAQITQMLAQPMRTNLIDNMVSGVRDAERNRSEGIMVNAPVRNTGGSTNVTNINNFGVVDIDPSIRSAIDMVASKGGVK